MRRRSCYMLMAGVATLGAGCGTVLAFYKQLGQSLSVIIGYAVLFISSVLIGLFLTGVSGDAKRTVFLVVIVLLLVVVLGTITALLFSLGGNVSRDMGLSEAVESVADTESYGALIESDLEGEVISGEPPDKEVNMDAVLPAISLIPTVEPASIPIEETEDSRAKANNPAPDTDGSISSINTSISDSIPNTELAPASDASYSVDSVEKHEDSVGLDETESSDDISESYSDGKNVAIEAGQDGAVNTANESLVSENKSVETKSADTWSITATDGSGTSEEDFFSGLSNEEADFWSTFFIEGEDELQLADGIYFMNLLINGEFTGSIEVLISSGEPGLQAAALKSYLDYTLTDAAKARVFTDRGSYITLSELENVGVGTSFDSNTYEVGLTFNVSDMPVQILSIRGSGNRSYGRPIAGAFDLEPSTFSLISRYTFNVGMRDVTSSNPLDNLYFGLSSYNNTRLFDVRLDFSWHMDFDLNDFNFRIGSYEFYVDFPDKMLRLSWGEVDTDLLSPTGKGIGVRIEKSTSYSDNVVLRSSSITQMLVIEKTSDVEIFNEGQSVYRRTLEPGQYRLQDFILYTGANRILIRVTPLDGSPVQEIDMDVLYSASLLSRGEFYYGATAAFSRSVGYNNRLTAPGTFSIPLWDGRSLNYDFRDVVLTGFIRAGLTDTFTIDTSLALQNKPTTYSAWGPNASLAIEMTNLNILGTTRYNLKLDSSCDMNGGFGLPRLDARISHQISTDIRELSSITIGASYLSPVDWDFTQDNSVSLNASASGSIGIMSWTLSGYGSLNVADISDYSWNISASMNFSFVRNFYLTTSVYVGGGGSSPVSVSGRVGATIRFGGTDINANTGFNDLSIRANGTYGDHSFSTAITSMSPSDIHSYGLEASYSYSGTRFSGGLNLDISDLADTVGISGSISTSTVFSDGLFAVASYIPNNYLLVSQEGALKGNSLSVGAPNSSSFSPVPMTFGTALYDGVSSHGDTGVVVYSSDDDQFGISQSLPVNLRSSRRNGYVLRMNADAEYTVSGIVYNEDGTLWANNASPVYSVAIADNAVSIENTDIYLFTDSDGRFILSGLSSGYYGFDVEGENGWRLMVIEVVDDPENYAELQLLGSAVETGYQVPAPYVSMSMYGFDRNMGSDEFFLMLYPEMEGVV